MKRHHIGLAFGAVLTLLAMATLGVASQPAGDPVSGVVAEVGDGMVWMTSGTSFGFTPNTRVTIVRAGTPADLVPGQYLAITAAPMEDGVLLASMISVFPEDQRGTGEGQRPMDGGNLMTNATIDDARIDAVNGGDLTVSFLGDTAVVRITPETRIELRSRGSLADVTPGANVTGSVTDGVAGTITIH